MECFALKFNYDCSRSCTGARMAPVVRVWLAHVAGCTRINLAFNLNFFYVVFVTDRDFTTARKEDCFCTILCA